MKKKTIFIIVYVFIGIMIFATLSSFITHDGYYVKQQWARQANRIYLDAQYVFSIEGDDEIIDFVICENKLYTVTIDYKEKWWGKTYYRVKAKTTYYVDKMIDDFNQTGECYWYVYNNLFGDTQMKWCIVNSSYDSYNDICNFFEFDYNGEAYKLFYQID